MLVCARPPDWPHELLPMELLAFINLSGTLRKGVQVFCTPDLGDPARTVYTAVRLTGRDRVPLEQCRRIASAMCESSVFFGGPWQFTALPHLLQSSSLHMTMRFEHP